jgi:hypothetical protein
VDSSLSVTFIAISFLLEVFPLTDGSQSHAMLPT